MRWSDLAPDELAIVLLLELCNARESMIAVERAAAAMEPEQREQMLKILSSINVQW